MSDQKKQRDFWIEGTSEEKEYDDIYSWKAWNFKPYDNLEPIHVREVLENDPRDAMIEKLKDALEDAEESLSTQHADLLMFHDEGCIPTFDEVKRADNSYKNVVKALADLKEWENGK